jgi:hypothetical protein
LTDVDADSDQSALESKPDIPDGSATGFLGTPARKTATAGIFDLEFKHSVAEAFSAADENSVVSLDGSKHATVKPKWNLRLPVERWPRSKK